MYDVFVRTWWKIENGKKVPHLGHKTFLAKKVSWETARLLCKEYNETQNPEKSFRKAVFVAIKIV